MLDRDRIGLHQLRKRGFASGLQKCRKGHLATKHTILIEDIAFSCLVPGELLDRSLDTGPSIDLNEVTADDVEHRAFHHLDMAAPL